MRYWRWIIPPEKRAENSRIETIPLGQIIQTRVLDQRTTRKPDYATENRALVAVAEAMDDPETILQRLVEETMAACGADSAGVSILEEGPDGEAFRWHAIAGPYARNAGQIIPRNESPCDLVLRDETVLLLAEPERHYPQIANTDPPIRESLLAPFYENGEAVGTLWALAHSDDNSFDAEDARVLSSLSRFASAGYQVLQSREQSRRNQRFLEHRVAQRTRALSESQNEIRRIDERMLRAMEISSVGIIFFTRDGRLTDANDAFLRMSGYSREDLESNQIRWDIMTPEEWIPASLEVVEQLFTQGLSTTYEKEYIRKDGTRWWGLFAGTQVSDDEGVEYIVDITESKKVEARLAASEQRFRAMVSQTNVAIAQGDLDGKFTFVNQGMTDLLGYEESELLGKHFLDFTHPEDAPRSAENYERLVSEGIPVQYEKRYLRRDGSVCWTSNSVAPVSDDDGNVHSVVALSVDISARVNAEAELRDSEAQFRALVHTTADALYRMSPDWSEMYELRSEAFIRDTIEAKQDWIDDYIHPDDQPRVLETIRQSIEHKTPFELEHRVRQTDGSLGWVFSRAVPMLDQDGEIQFWFGAGSDITARKHAEEALRENESRLTERVAEATAELRSLSRQLLQVQEAERRNLAYELHDEIGQSLTALSFSLEMAGRESENQHLEEAQSITRDLLQKVRALTLELRPSSLDTLGLVPAVLALTETFSARTGVRVDLFHEGMEKRYPPEIETVAYRIIQEALTNVARHSGADKATVQLMNGDNPTVWISDTGAGFDVERARASSLSTGLIGMQERASLVGGELVIDSTSGEGTTIIFELPNEPDEDLPLGESV